MLSDAQLARAAQKGDAVGLGILLERHRAPLHAMALQILGHGPQAQDAVQDAFLVAMKKIELLREPARSSATTTFEVVLKTSQRSGPKAAEELGPFGILARGVDMLRVAPSLPPPTRRPTQGPTHEAADARNPPVASVPLDRPARPLPEPSRRGEDAERLAPSAPPFGDKHRADRPDQGPDHAKRRTHRPLLLWR